MLIYVKYFYKNSIKYINFVVISNLVSIIKYIDKQFVILGLCIIFVLY